jgi:hypothetical protein
MSAARVRSRAGLALLLSEPMQVQASSSSFGFGPRQTPEQPLASTALRHCAISFHFSKCDSLQPPESPNLLPPIYSPDIASLTPKGWIWNSIFVHRRISD